MFHNIHNFRINFGKNCSVAKLVFAFLFLAYVHCTLYNLDILASKIGCYYKNIYYTKIEYFHKT